MKLTFEKHVGDMLVVLPRATLTADESAKGLGEREVSLARRGQGACSYPLAKLSEHDFHAPAWALDGAAPSGSSAPDVTVESYVKRIVDDIKALGDGVEVEVEMVEAQGPKHPGASGSEDDEDPWTKYGVN